MNRPGAVAIAVAAAVLSSAPVTTADAAAGGDHTSGAPGQFNPRDQFGAGTGVRCHYNASGVLRSVSVITPKVKALRRYSSQGLRSYVKLADQVQQRAHGTWVAVGSWHQAPETELKAKSGWQILKPVGTIGLSSTKVNATYRVRERIQWKDYNSHTALIGSVIHVMGAYYYRRHGAPATSCHDQRPTATSFNASVQAGKSLTRDLLTHAKDADHDALRLGPVTATKNGDPISVGVQPNGSITIPTEQADAGKTVVVHWSAIDPAGVHSSPATLTVSILDQFPGVPTDVTVSNVQTQDTTPGNPTGVTATVTWTAPSSGDNHCYDIRAVIMESTDSGATFNPVAATPFETDCATTATSQSNISVGLDNDSHPNYVLWEVRGRNLTNHPGDWSTAASSTIPDETGNPGAQGPDAAQVLHYAGYWVDYLAPTSPPDCTYNDSIASQSPHSGTYAVSTTTNKKVVLQEYGECGP